MLKSARRFFKHAISSRFGQLLAIIHLGLIVYEFAQKDAANIGCTDEIRINSDLIAGRWFHWHYESVLLKIITLLDLPGFLLALAIGWLIYLPSNLFFPSVCRSTASWIAAFYLLIGTSIQWWFIGYGLESIIRRKRIET